MNIVKEIKYKRLPKVEQFFLESIDGMILIEAIKYPLSKFWIKDNEILFEKDFSDGVLYVNFHKIWKIYRNTFRMGYDDTVCFIKKMATKYLKWYGLVAQSYKNRNFDELNDYIKTLL